MSRTDQTYVLKIKDVAEFFNVTERHIDRLVVEGRFPEPVYVGAAKRWNLEQLETWAAQNTGRPTGDTNGDAGLA